jgi:hypothetical protein
MRFGGAAKLRAVLPGQVRPLQGQFQPQLRLRTRPGLPEALFGRVRARTAPGGPKSRPRHLRPAGLLRGRSVRGVLAHRRGLPPLPERLLVQLLGRRLQFQPPAARGRLLRRVPDVDHLRDLQDGLPARVAHQLRAAAVLPQLPGLQPVGPGHPVRDLRQLHVHRQQRRLHQPDSLEPDQLPQLLPDLRRLHHLRHRLRADHRRQGLQVQDFQLPGLRRLHCRRCLPALQPVCGRVLPGQQQAVLCHGRHRQLRRVRRLHRRLLEVPQRLLCQQRRVRGGHRDRRLPHLFADPGPEVRHVPGQLRQVHRPAGLHAGDAHQQLQDLLRPHRLLALQRRLWLGGRRADLQRPHHRQLRRLLRDHLHQVPGRVYLQQWRLRGGDRRPEGQLRHHPDVRHLFQRRCEPPRVPAVRPGRQPRRVHPGPALPAPDHPGHRQRWRGAGRQLSGLAADLGHLPVHQVRR